MLCAVDSGVITTQQVINEQKRNAWSHTCGKSTGTNHTTHTNKTLLSDSQLKADYSDGFFIFIEPSYSKKSMTFMYIRDVNWIWIHYSWWTDNVINRYKHRYESEAYYSYFARKACRALKLKLCTGTGILRGATKKLHVWEISCRHEQVVYMANKVH